MPSPLIRPQIFWADPRPAEMVAAPFDGLEFPRLREMPDIFEGDAEDPRDLSWG